jgi:hypothetical protein
MPRNGVMLISSRASLGVVSLPTNRSRNARLIAPLNIELHTERNCDLKVARTITNSRNDMLPEHVITCFVRSMELIVLTLIACFWNKEANA